MSDHGVADGFPEWVATLSPEDVNRADFGTVAQPAPLRCPNCGSGKTGSRYVSRPEDVTENADGLPLGPDDPGGYEKDLRIAEEHAALMEGRTIKRAEVTKSRSGMPSGLTLELDDGSRIYADALTTGGMELGYVSPEEAFETELAMLGEEAADGGMPDCTCDEGREAGEAADHSPDCRWGRWQRRTGWHA